METATAASDIAQVLAPPDRVESAVKARMDARPAGRRGRPGEMRLELICVLAKLLTFLRNPT
jgi:hypothetical protein